MRCIGLTGGIATGKSTVAALLACRGACVIDADALAREVVAPGQPALAEITRRFGGGALGPDGHLNRAALGRLVFADAPSRRDLEGITHPRIVALLEERVVRARAHDPVLIVVDIPLLFEHDLGAGLDGVLVVHVSPRTQMERLMARDGHTADEARARLASQMPIDEKRDRATWVIDNGGEPAATEQQVERWWRTVVGVEGGPCRR